MKEPATFIKLWRLGPPIALATVVFLIVAGAAMIFYNEQAYRQQKLDEVGVQARILSSTVSAALVFDDRPAAQEYVNAMAANFEVRAAAIYDQNGALFVDYVRGNAEMPPAQLPPDAPRIENGRLVVTAPVIEGQSALGTVYLQTITEPFARRLERYGIIGLLVFMASLIVAVLGAAQVALGRVNQELESRAAALADANRQLQRQIQERELVQEALRQSQKMEAIGQLSGGIAHDFNNLLTIVMGNLQLLQKRLAEGRTDVAQYVEFAMDGLNRAANVTQRILAFSRRQPLAPNPVKLSRLTTEMGDLLRQSVGAGIAVETRLAADWWTLCDENQMENVILNLAINSRDAMPEGGKLVIETADLHLARPEAPFADAPPGDYVRLSVIDNGAGMSEEVRRRAIDPFFTTKPQGQGTGLGLSMIFGFIQQSKGYFHIDSKLGEGTRVIMLLPRYQGDGAVDDAAAPAPAASVARSQDRPAKKSTVLVVEDEELVRTLVVETIRDEGFTVIERADGTSALDVLNSEVEIDLLLSDVRLPGANGYKLAEIGMARRPQMKVLLMTGFTQDPIPENLARAGIIMLYKPYKLGDLVVYANQLLKAKRDPATP
ncbi:MAG TPA: CHASE sensor domain-containing protein [Stellaceae bacterium]|nr:CHASE sensor domain-containing protein [Stellaceae bacterium]